MLQDFEQRAVGAGDQVRQFRRCRPRRREVYQKPIVPRRTTAAWPAGPAMLPSSRTGRSRSRTGSSWTTPRRRPPGRPPGVRAAGPPCASADITSGAPIFLVTGMLGESPAGTPSQATSGNRSHAAAAMIRPVRKVPSHCSGPVPGADQGDHQSPLDRQRRQHPRASVGGVHRPAGQITRPAPLCPPAGRRTPGSRRSRRHRSSRALPPRPAPCRARHSCCTADRPRRRSVVRRAHRQLRRAPWPASTGRLAAGLQQVQVGDAGQGRASRRRRCALAARNPNAKVVPVTVSARVRCRGR